jgi:formylglycine-generating enzyme required for sulfatase activity
MRARRLMAVLALAVGFGLVGAPAPAWASDVDGDGVDDAVDVCSNTPAGTAVDAEGRPLGDIDQDCDTDLDDFALFQQGMTGPLPPPGMVLIPGGEFAMGCHAETGESCYYYELPVHDVYVNPFYMDLYQVTNQQYCAYLNSAYGQGLIEVSSGVVYKAGDTEPYCDTTTSSSYSRITWTGSTFGITTGKEDHPMVMVSWYGAVAYCNWRSAQHGRTPCYDLSAWTCDFDANGCRLPTEAEWECAARGGEHDPYYAYPWGNTIEGSQANYWDSGDPYEGGGYPETTPVGYYDGGQTPPGSDMANGHGLYDVAGNVFEWCHDWRDLDYYDSSPYDNPQGPASGEYRILRGGSWDVDGVSYSRCAFRLGHLPDDRDNGQGFRVAAGM